MAAYLIKEEVTKDFLTCSICRSVFQNPKTLPCLHTFCKDCLESSVANRDQSCPLCRDEFDLPLGGVGALKTNFFITDLHDYFEARNTGDGRCGGCRKPEVDAVARCLNCDYNLCAACTTTHPGSPNSRVHHTIHIDQYKRQLLLEPESLDPDTYCDRHPGEILKVFCVKCQIPICVTCAAVDHPEPLHRRKHLHEAAEDEKYKMQPLIVDLEILLGKIRKDREDVEREIADLEQTQQQLEKRIDSHAESLVNYITQQQKERKKELFRLCFRKRRNLEARRSTISVDEGAIERARDAAERLTDTASPILYLQSLDVMRNSITGLLSKGAKTWSPEKFYLDFLPSHKHFDGDIGKFLNDKSPLKDRMECIRYRAEGAFRRQINKIQ
ncbi:E3 ubiquitin-protein ligase TRIM56-like [Ptychodera flava]|uniref:E3 ubiquitin-protein ligase TRIM56-like n=1 Tax=Ptychodera flava TaxID=63121 RepID=UPI003969C142